MNVIFVGAGGTTRELLRRLGELWDVIVVDTDGERLAQAEKARPIDQVEGDGSSRVVLERAGLERADAVVAATSDDEVNMEVCRIAIDAGVLRVAAVAADPELLDRYRELGVPAFSPDSLAARRVESELEPRRVSSSAFAHGQAEAIEFVISPDSPVRNMALRDLHSERYLVAAILRDGKLVIPHGDTTLDQGDLVTVVGAATDFSMIVRTFSGGEARFPVDFGKNVVMALETAADLEVTLPEAVALTRNSQADSLVVVHRNPQTVRDEAQGVEIESLLEKALEVSEGVEVTLRPSGEVPSKALLDLVSRESAGVVVLPAPPVGELLGRWRAVKALRRALHFDTPVFMSRGTFGSGSIVAPARDTGTGRILARAAIDLAVYTKSPLVGVAVVSPQFLAGGMSKSEAQRAMQILREEAAVLGVRVRRRIRQGNPVRILEEAAEGAGLLVLGMPSGSPTWGTPGIVGHLLRRLDVSILLVPPIG